MVVMRDGSLVMRNVGKSEKGPIKVTRLKECGEFGLLRRCRGVCRSEHTKEMMSRVLGVT